MIYSEWKRIVLYGAVAGIALVLAGVFVSHEPAGRSAAVGRGKELQKTEAIVWTGDMEALALLRENGVVAVESRAVDVAEDPYPYLHAGKQQAQEGQRESEAPSEDTNSSEPAKEAKVIYLTFDDGPSRNTEKILDILEAYHAKATFFLIGENLTDTGVEIAKRAVSEGHMLGMHTECHQYGKIYASADNLLRDYNQLAKRFLETFGECPVCCRFPGGSCSSYINPIRDELKKELAERGFLCYDWNVSGEDSVGTPTAASIKKNIFGRIYEVEEPIVLLHDSPCNRLTVEILPQILERLCEEGYEFRTLSDREPYAFPW